MRLSRLRHTIFNCVKTSTVAGIVGRLNCRPIRRRSALAAQLPCSREKNIFCKNITHRSKPAIDIFETIEKHKWNVYSGIKKTREVANFKIPPREHQEKRSKWQKLPAVLREFFKFFHKFQFERKNGLTITERKRKRKRKRRKRGAEGEKEKTISQRKRSLGVIGFPLKGAVARSRSAGSKVKDWQSRFSSSGEHTSLRLSVSKASSPGVYWSFFPRPAPTNPGGALRSRANQQHAPTHIFGRTSRNFDQEVSWQTLINAVIMRWGRRSSSPDRVSTRSCVQANSSRKIFLGQFGLTFNEKFSLSFRYLEIST